MDVPTTRFVHEERVYAYRRLTPPTFLNFPGMGRLLGCGRD
jgi:hypothetical protein